MTEDEDVQQHADLYQWLTNPFGAANVRGAWPCGTFKVMAAELERPVDELAAAMRRHPAGKRR